LTPCGAKERKPPLLRVVLTFGSNFIVHARALRALGPT
jgi:hypothetical protein